MYIFLFCPTEFASNADDNALYAMESCLKETLQKVEEASNILPKLFSNNYMVVNAARCHLLPLGVVIQNRLTFKPQMEHLHRKAGKKFHVVARISNCMQ